MKKTLRVLKWISFTIVSILVLLAIFLGMNGVPKSPSMTTENIPRIPLSFVKQAYNLINEYEDNARFFAWGGLGDQMIVIKSKNLKSKLHLLNGINQKPKPIEGLPDYISVYIGNPNPEINESIYTKDLNGNEKFQLYKFDLETGTSTLLTNGEDRHSSPMYNHTGEKIIYLKNKTSETNYSIYSMDVGDTTSEKLILELNDSYILDDWSRDGKKILLRKSTSVTDREPFILNIETGELTSLAIDTAAKTNYYHQVWSKDENIVYYPSSYQSEFMRLHARDLTTGKDTILINNANWNIGYLEMSPDGKWLMYKLAEDGKESLYFYHTEEGKSKSIKGLPLGTVSASSFHPGKNSTVGFNLIYPNLMTDIFSYDVEADKLIKWTESEEDLQFPAPEVVHYPTFDLDTITGKTRTISAYYHRPPTATKKPYPVIIDIHGGPESQATLLRSGEWSVKMNEGFAYLVPNVRGSTGYGQTFTDLDNGKLRENSVKDIGALLDWIELQPELDAGRVFVQGGSYGGYMALACATHYSDRLAGAIDLFGISNFLSFLKNTGEYRVDLRRVEYGDERDPDMKAFLEEISPLNHIDKINIPLLIIQGKTDPRVPVSESRQMVDKLKAAGKSVWYIEAEDEGHGFRKPWNSIYSKMVEFQFINEIMAKSN